MPPILPLQVWGPWPSVSLPLLRCTSDGKSSFRWPLRSFWGLRSRHSCCFCAVGALMRTFGRVEIEVPRDSLVESDGARAGPMSHDPNGALAVQPSRQLSDDVPGLATLDGAMIEAPLLEEPSSKPKPFRRHRPAKGRP